MSLTSYRAAPPRVWILGILFWLFVSPILIILGFMDGLEDLAATYSPVP
jgi:hypothetical protein